MFVRGKVAATTKCDPAGVEIYGKERYLTVTEDHIEGTPIDIRPAPQTLEMLLSRVEAMRPKREEPASAAPRFSTTPRPAAGKVTGGNKFFRNVNDLALQSLGKWVPALHPSAKYQDSTGAYRVSSKALGRTLQEDLAFHPDGIVDHGTADMGHPNQGKYSPIDSVIEWGGAPDEIAAAKWLCDRMGKTPESLGWVEGAQPNEEMREIGDQFVAGLLKRAGIVIEPEREPEPETGGDEADEADGGAVPDALTRPGGLLEDIVDWVDGTSTNPDRAVGLAVAISALGAACGRAFVGPTNSGSHFYIALLGPTGAGKEHAKKTTRKILESAGMDESIGSGKFTSSNALEAQVIAAPITVCLMDEVGSEIAKFNNPRASEHLKGMTHVLLELWGTNRGTYKTTRYAQSKGVDIKAPSFSILGMGTEDNFWPAFQGLDIVSGFMNRFMLLRMSKKYQRGRTSPPLGLIDDADVPNVISDRLLSIRGNGCSDSDFRIIYGCGGSTTFTTIKTGFANAEVVVEYDDYREKNRLLSYKSPEISPYFARSAEMALRLAMLRAIGHRRLMIERDDLKWGIAIMEYSASSMMRGARFNMASNDFEGHRNHVIRLVNKARKMGCDRQIIAKNVKLKPRDLNDVLGSLQEGGLITETLVQSRKDGRGGPIKKLYFPGPAAD